MGRAGTILVVEDDAEIRSLLASRLERAGYRPVVAANGREALDRLAEEVPDVMLLDWMMPTLGGAEVLEHVATDPRLRALPVVVISAVDRPVSTAHPIAVMLGKPVRMRTILAVVGRLIGLPPLDTPPLDETIGRARHDTVPDGADATARIRRRAT